MPSHRFAPLLAKSCRVLFGEHRRVSAGFLYNLDYHKLKRAYRQKAMQFHPDRSAVLHHDKKKLTFKFRLIHEAYENLLAYLDHKARQVLHTVYNKNQKQQRSRPARPQQEDHFYQGNLPRHKLRFGQFLYYSGLISWRTLIEAIVWQRRNRDSLGKLARQSGFLAGHEAEFIRRRMKTGDFFGETAQRLGFITGAQVKVLLHKQILFGAKIGQYFLRQNVFDDQELVNHLLAFLSHNARYG